MTGQRPAWSSQFALDTLRDVAAISPLDDVTADWAWGGSTGRGIKVAVIDSGIDNDHPAIDGHVAGFASIEEAGDDIVVATEPHNDVFGHGTACAGIIRSHVPDCELYSVRVLGPRLTGRGTVFAAGLRWAIENGMHVCNLSLGTTRRDFVPLFYELADDAAFKNTVLVTAANNLPSPSFPSLFSSVISVASHELQDPDIYFYNPNPPVDFGAAGIDVRVPWKGGEWITATGNSFAAPHISGLVARLLGKHPDLKPFQVKTILRALAANVSREYRADHSAHGAIATEQRPAGNGFESS